MYVCESPLSIPLLEAMNYFASRRVAIEDAYRH